MLPQGYCQEHEAQWMGGRCRLCEFERSQRQRAAWKCSDCKATRPHCGTCGGQAWRALKAVEEADERVEKMDDAREADKLIPRGTETTVSDVLFCVRCHAQYTAAGGIPGQWNAGQGRIVPTCSQHQCGGVLDEHPPSSDCGCRQCSPQSFVEAVEHPRHYGGADNVYETIKVLRSWLPRLPLNPYQAGVMFNVIKYLSRAGLKGDLIEDLKKAQWYLNELIEDVQRGVSNEGESA